MKKPVKILVIVIVALFALCILKDAIIKTVVSVVASQITGAKVEIGGFSLGVFKQSVRIKNLRIYNPKGFSDGILVDLPRANVDYDLPSLIKGKLHLPKVDIFLKEMRMEKNKNGKLNVDSLAVVKKQEKGKSAKQMPMQIDEISLQMGRIISTDYSEGEPIILVYSINLKKTYRNITSAHQFAALIISEPLKSAGIQGAAIYTVAAFTGIGAIPIIAGSTLLKESGIEAEFALPFKQVYDTALKFIKKKGIVISHSSIIGEINASVRGADINIDIKKIGGGKTRVRVAARKYFIPRPEIAAGLLYEIEKELK